MKSKSWFFGDSFTYGNYIDFLGKRYPKWTQIVSDELEMFPINFGEGGIATQDIINRFIMEMGNISSNDFVFISDTNPIRHLDVVKKSEGYSIGTVNTDLLYYNPSSITEQTDSITDYVDIKTATTYIDYIYNFRMNHSSLWEVYYRNLIISLKKEMLRRNIEFYYWSSQLWRNQNRFTTISYESKGVELDGHWGPEGHSDMAKYMIKRIKDKKYIMESEFIESPYKVI